MHFLESRPGLRESDRSTRRGPHRDRADDLSVVAFCKNTAAIRTASSFSAPGNGTTSTLRL